MTDSPLRVAVLGAGGAAQVVHLPILARLPGVELAGIADPDLPKALSETLKRLGAEAPRKTD